MKSRLLITAAMLCLAMPAAADFVTKQQAYEVALSKLRLPQSENGTLAFQSCDACDWKTERVTVTTRYKVNGRVLPLDKFRIAVSKVVNRDEESVMVLHHLADDRITEVSVYL